MDFKKKSFYLKWKIIFNPNNIFLILLLNGFFYSYRIFLCFNLNNLFLSWVRIRPVLRDFAKTDLKYFSCHLCFVTNNPLCLNLFQTHQIISRGLEASVRTERFQHPLISGSDFANCFWKEIFLALRIYLCLSSKSTLSALTWCFPLLLFLSFFLFLNVSVRSRLAIIKRIADIHCCGDFRAV